MREKPNLMRVKVVGEDGTETMQTVRADEIQKSEKKHESLSYDLAKRAKAIWSKVKYWHPDQMSQRQWLDGFLYDLHPEKEIVFWEKFVRLFEKCLVKFKPADQQATHRLFLAALTPPLVSIEYLMLFVNSSYGYAITEIIVVRRWNVAGGMTFVKG